MIGPNEDGKSAVATLNGSSRKKEEKKKEPRTIYFTITYLFHQSVAGQSVHSQPTVPSRLKSLGPIPTTQSYHWLALACL